MHSGSIALCTARVLRGMALGTARSQLLTPPPVLEVTFRGVGDEA